MAYKYGARNQVTMFPKSLDELVKPNDPVRAYDAFVDSLDIRHLGISIDKYKVGNSEYDPHVMIKLILYGCSYGWRSSRKLERALHHNISFIWLTGGLKPDHATISRFRQNNKKALTNIFKKCVRICLDLDLIDGNTLFVDGTKIRANAARGKNYTEKKYKKMLGEIENRIEEIFHECDEIDRQESEQGSFVKMKKELADNQQLRDKIKNILEEFEEQGAKTKNGKERTKNLTDCDSALMRSIQGSHASYNIQTVGDNKHSLLANIDVVSDTSDVNQFAEQIEKAEKMLEKQCDTAVGDAGYADTEELEKIDKRGTKVIVPSQRQAAHNEEEKEFSKSHFQYDEDKNCYYCPVGHILSYRGKEYNGKKLIYQIMNADNCKQCQNYGVCTKAKKGRKIKRLSNEKAKEKFEQLYEQEENQEIYKRRKACIEHPFGHIKQNLGIRNFLLRGIDGIRAESAIAGTCFNVVRMLTIFGGVQEFMVKLQTL